MHDVILFVPPRGNHPIATMFGNLNVVLREHGLNSKVMPVEEWSPRESCSISVGLGGDKPATTRGRVTGNIIRHQKATGNRHIVVDRGYIYKRQEYWSVGWDALNGRANFCNSNMDHRRIEEWGISMRPWKLNPHGFVLFCLQLPWDAAVNNTHYPTFVRDATEKILKETGRDIILRNHPLISTGGCSQLPIANEYRAEVDKLLRNDRVRLSHSVSIEDDFDKAWCAVAYNSNSTVDATLYGVPSFVADRGSMTWDISRHDLKIEEPITPNRHQWLCDLSYTQWSVDEVSEAIPFKQLGVI